MEGVLKSVIAFLGVEVDDSKLDGVDDKLSGVLDTIKAVGAALGVSQLVGWLNDTADAADALQDVADRAGTSTASLQAWQFAGKRAGLEAENVAMALGFLNKNLAAASSGGKEQAKAFRDLGVSVKDAGGEIRSIDDILIDVAEGISNIDNPVKKAGAAIDIFGKSGQMLLPLLNRGADGVEALRKEFDALGGGFSQEAIDAAGEYNDQLDRFNVVARSVKSSLLTLLLPSLTALDDTQLRVARGIKYLTEETDLLKSALIVAGGFVVKFAASWAAANAGMLASTAASTVGLGALVLAVEDVYSAFTGKESVFGDFLAGLGNLETGEQAVRALTQSFEDLVAYLESVDFGAIANRIRKALTITGAMSEAVRMFSDDPRDANLPGDDRAGGIDRHEARRKAARDAAVASGDLEGYISNTSGARATAGEARKQFLEDREKYLVESKALGIDAANDNDRAEGLAPAAAREPAKVVAPRVNNVTNTKTITGPTINLLVSPRTSREQLDEIRKVSSEEAEKHYKRALAGLDGGALEDG